jgi:hypothetical protein
VSDQPGAVWYEVWGREEADPEPVLLYRLPDVATAQLAARRLIARRVVDVTVRVATTTGEE